MVLPTKRAVLPDLDHITLELATKIYEPAEDTYLLCDSLLHEIDEIAERRPRTLLEVGCGSGCVITYLSMLLKDRNVDYHAIAVDINPVALETTKVTAEANHVEIELRRSDLFEAVEGSHAGGIDVMIFNPPYVPTPSEEIGGQGIEAAWAGGIDGREVIDRFLPKVKTMLSPAGVLYMILVQENRPNDVAAILARDHLAAKVIYRTKAVNESLMVMKVEHSK